ncbi:Protein of unknown function [Thermoactinomyces sp. DSM 45891]|uniref:DUF2975 domain-containing protein n=1 Tax=Thermoactinomyces sp. DSM 45891 TaxID=1761907 RepID=UPI000916369B|nr:DUF2975 domain-containing protein [Thermoactinomyces sp. DSM 45891]SFX54549.1 Protein of unknown function [Thermoactinomyces sp. DSM 45891]
MKRASTLFLRIAVFMIGLPILVLCIFSVPKMAHFAATLYPNFASIKYLVFIVMYGAAIPFYFALYQAFHLLQYIDENKAFSALSIKSLKNIQRSAIAISGLYVLGLPLFHFIGRKVDPPVGLVGVIIVLASLMIAVFVTITKRLLQEVIRIKSENDLTV